MTCGTSRCCLSEDRPDFDSQERLTNRRHNTADTSRQMFIYSDTKALISIWWCCGAAAQLINITALTLSICFALGQTRAIPFFNFLVFTFHRKCTLLHDDACVIMHFVFSNSSRLKHPNKIPPDSPLRLVYWFTSCLHVPAERRPLPVVPQTTPRFYLFSVLRSSMWPAEGAARQ